MGQMTEQKGTDYWKPEKEGEQLKGIISAIGDGNFGKQYTLTDEEGRLVTTPSHKVLQARMVKAQLGKKVDITFEGTEPATKPGHSATAMYKVLLEE